MELVDMLDLESSAVKSVRVQVPSKVLLFLRIMIIKRLFYVKGLHMEEQIKMGVKVEQEHKDTYLWFLRELRLQRTPTLNDFAEHIAKDHLKENKKYYTFLHSMEELVNNLKKKV